MAGFSAPTGSTGGMAAGSSNTPAGSDVSSTDLGGMGISDAQPSYSPPGQQAPVDQYNYTPTNQAGTYALHIPGQAAPAHMAQINSKRALNPKQLGGAIQHLRSAASGGARIRASSGGAAVHVPTPHVGTAAPHMPRTTAPPRPSSGFRSSGLRTNGGLKAGVKVPSVKESGMSIKEPALKGGGGFKK